VFGAEDVHAVHHGPVCSGCHPACPGRSLRFLSTGGTFLSAAGAVGVKVQTGRRLNLCGGAGVTYPEVLTASSLAKSRKASYRAPDVRPETRGHCINGFDPSVPYMLRFI